MTNLAARGITLRERNCHTEALRKARACVCVCVCVCVCEYFCISVCIYVLMYVRVCV
jgi:hypothetical protein